MPYITQEDRKKIDPAINDLLAGIREGGASPSIFTAGPFTYAVYRLLKGLFCGSFWARALGIGCLVCAILELYRKEHARYEDQKIQENGDV